MIFQDLVTTMIRGVELLEERFLWGEGEGGGAPLCKDKINSTYFGMNAIGTAGCPGAASGRAQEYGTCRPETASRGR